MKTCGRCEVDKDEWHFSRNRSREDGLSGWCKMCVSKAARERRGLVPADWKRKTVDMQAYQKEYRKKNAEHIRELKRLHWAKRKEKLNVADVQLEEMKRGCDTKCDDDSV